MSIDISTVDESGLKTRKKRVLTRKGAPLLFAYEANTFWQRYRGIKAVPKLSPTDALIIKPCSSVHTFGLQQSLDVLFVGLHGEILKALTLEPRSISVCFDAALVIEMSVGTIKRLDFQVGQRIVPENETW